MFKYQHLQMFGWPRWLNRSDWGSNPDQTADHLAAALLMCSCE